MTANGCKVFFFLSEENLWDLVIIVKQLCENRWLPSDSSTHKGQGLTLAWGPGEVSKRGTLEEIHQRWGGVQGARQQRQAARPRSRNVVT